MTVVIIASGPSLTQEDVDYCRDKATVYVVNNAYKLAPWADLLYACDLEWWDHYKPDFSGQKWTLNPEAAEKHDLNLIPYEPGLRFGTKDTIGTGQNSGFQALNLSYILGHRKAILLGFDFKNTGEHFFGRHPGAMNKTPDMRPWVRHMSLAAPEMKEAGFEVINCTRDTAIDAFPMMDIKEALC